MKKILTIILVLSLLISNFIFASAITLPKETDWYYEAVKYCNENGLIEGVLPEGEIRYQPLTRAEFLTIFMNAMDVDYSKVIPGNKFSDVEKDSWYEKPVYWAASYSIVRGISWDKFNPAGNITREDAATIIYRYFEAVKINHKEIENPVEFTDSSSVSSYALDAVKDMAKYGLFVGDDNKNFLPKKNITQPQGLTLFMRLHKSVVNGDLVFVEEDKDGSDSDIIIGINTEVPKEEKGITPVPDLFVTYNGKEYNLNSYEDFRPYAIALSDDGVSPLDIYKSLEKHNRQSTPGGDISWMPPQKLKATDSIEENVDNLSEDNLAPIEWLEDNDFRELREKIAEELNRVRIEAGGGTLTINEGLMATAQNKAEQHARAGMPLRHSVTLSYTGWTPNTPKDINGQQPNGSEVLYYCGYIPDYKITVATWMASKGHKNTIMGKPITTDSLVGVGVARIKGQGYIICAVFAGESTFSFNK